MQRLKGRMACVCAGCWMAWVVAAHGDPPAVIASADGRWRMEIQAGVGYWAGDATYSIGGKAWSPDEGTVDLPKKISELTFPLDVPYGSIGGRLTDGRLEFHGTAMVNLGDPSSQVTDSDWGVFHDDTLDVYSLSDAKLTAVMMDGGARYWLRKIAPDAGNGWSVGVGPALHVAMMDWTASHVDQWYPSRPELGHEYEAGRAATYTVAVVMPYLDVCADARLGKLSGKIGLGAGPVGVADEDDHLLRQKRSTGEMAGVGIKASAEIRYEFSKAWFATANVDVFSIEANGTQTQKGYGGELTGYYAEIDEEYSFTSVNGGVAVGCKF